MGIRDFGGSARSEHGEAALRELEVPTGVAREEQSETQASVRRATSEDGAHAAIEGTEATFSETELPTLLADKEHLRNRGSGSFDIGRR